MNAERVAVEDLRSGNAPASMDPRTIGWRPAVLPDPVSQLQLQSARFEAISLNGPYQYRYT
jgi:hypothetical protein